MGFDFDCVLCSLLMFHSMFTQLNTAVYILTFASHARTLTYAARKSEPYVTFALHLMMVSQAKRRVIVLRTVSFKRVSAFPSLSGLVESNEQPSAHTHTHIKHQRSKSEKEWERMIATKYCIRLVSISLCGIFLLAQCLMLLPCALLLLQRKQKIQRWIIAFGGGGSRKPVTLTVWLCFSLSLSLHRCACVIIFLFDALVLPIYLLHIWDWLFKLKLMKTSVDGCKILLWSTNLFLFDGSAKVLYCRMEIVYFPFWKVVNI